MNVPRKGDIIINPNTQRPVKVGSRTWLNLVKQGVVEGRYTDPRELATIPEGNEGIEQQIEDENKKLPRGQQAVRGRGRYKGKIVRRHKRPNTEDVSRYTAKIASKTVKENLDDLADCDDMEAELERLILQEMAGSDNRSTFKKTVVGIPTKAKREKDQYVLKEIEEEYTDCDDLDEYTDYDESDEYDDADEY
jgi:hypothetical protein